MSNLVPHSFFDFPAFRMPSVFDDVDEFLNFPEMTTQGPQSGLSVSEDDKHVHVDAAVPGMDPKDIEVTFDKGVLWIRGQAKEEEKNEKKKYYRRAQRAFSYRVAVPGDIDSKVEPQTSYENGMVRITFAKSPQTQPKKLTIKLNGKGTKESKSK